MPLGCLSRVVRLVVCTPRGGQLAAGLTVRYLSLAHPPSPTASAAGLARPLLALPLHASPRLARPASLGGTLLLPLRLLSTSASAEPPSTAVAGAAPPASPLLPPALADESLSVAAAPSVVESPTVVSGPISLVRFTIESIHEYLHLPWWLTIIVASVVLRMAITLPLAIYQAKIFARLELVTPMLAALQERHQRELAALSKKAGVSYNDYVKLLSKKLREEHSAIFATYKCNPQRAFFAPLLQIPLWVCVTVALRQIAGQPMRLSDALYMFRQADDAAQETLVQELLASGAVSDASEAAQIIGNASTKLAEQAELLNPTHVSSGLDSGGLLWFSDLSAQDPHYVIPVALVMSYLYNIHLSSLNPNSRTLYSRVMQNIFRLMSLVVGWAAAFSPSAVSLYWLASSLYSTAQNVALRVPAVRKALGIPIVPSMKSITLPFPFQALNSSIQAAGARVVPPKIKV